ncbi:MULTISPECIES: RelA/SpoT domain-containing protein [unclassified Novosphingobium]|uniref:RelA/SpoT domain-containing protein n=1 Tax=unclassified Novosphingobium TaxID=2644732 RepID=UPI0025ED2802|nr:MULTISPECIES: RelA/SpoT domain-containing protein [unclassified Novosphingobium]HQV04974.1 RelA/SpoT domain-containing protein [Novosphingobium sp.]
MAKTPTAEDSGGLPEALQSVDDQLQLEVVEALRGADNLRERLQHALQSGAPSVSELAYAIKSRVKEDYKAIEKIRDRRFGSRNRDPKPAYCAMDLTDLVGVRIVTLYRLDVFEILEVLLETIERDQSESAVFVKNSISEVVIYSTNPTGDVQDFPRRVCAFFDSRGFSDVTRIEEKPSNYTSIHIVIRGRGKYRDEYREIPVEIQIRTALEDVWGQIEHSLKYKRRTLSGSGGEAVEHSRIATTLSHLGALKTMIDGIAQYADQIKLQIDEQEPDIRAATSKSAEEIGGRLASLTDIPQNLRSELALLVDKSNLTLSKMDRSVSFRVRKLREISTSISEKYEEIISSNQLKPRSLRELKYICEMHRALIHYQIGNLTYREGDDLRIALELYSSLEKLFPRRSIVIYRLAKALASAGARTKSIEKFRYLIDHLDDDPLPTDHWIRSAAPRMLGVLLWEEAISIRSAMTPVGSENRRSLAMISEAIRVTEFAFLANVGDDPLSESDTSEKVRAANNILYYLLEYLSWGGRPKAGLDDSRVRELLLNIGEGSDRGFLSLATAETARRAYAFLKDADRELAAAECVMRFAASDRTPRSMLVRDAIRAAERVIVEARRKKP